MAPTFPLTSVPKDVLKLIRTLRSAGYGAWLVGGCVRDSLMGRPVSDWDVASSATPEEVQGCFRKVIPTGLAHGTVTVLVGRESIEVTTLRGEGAYSDGRRPDEVFFVKSIDEDLARRDFTVNALAVDDGGVVVDPFGGLADLESRVMRAVGDPLERFTEDGLRILRGARFAATLEFSLEANTERAFRATLPIFAKVSPERVRDELVKAMKADAPSITYRIMARNGLLQVCAPALGALDEGAFDGCLAALDRLPPGDSATKIETRFAALLRPLARDDADQWLRDYRFSNSQRKAILAQLDGLAEDALAMDSDDFRRWAAKNYSHLDALAALSAAEHQNDALAQRIAELDREAMVWELSQLPIKGSDVIRALGAPGPRVGIILRTLLDEVIVQPSRCDRDYLLERVDALARTGAQ